MSQPQLFKLPDIAISQADRRLLKQCDGRPYTVRFTVDQGKKYVGKRVSVSTGTKDIRIAAMCRRLMIDGLKAAGFILSDIKFGKPQEDFNNLALHDNITKIIVDLGNDPMAGRLQDAVDNSK